MKSSEEFILIKILKSWQKFNPFIVIVYVSISKSDLLNNVWDITNYYFFFFSF